MGPINSKKDWWRIGNDNGWVQQIQDNTFWSSSDEQLIYTLSNDIRKAQLNFSKAVVEARSNPSDDAQANLDTIQSQIKTLTDQYLVVSARVNGQ
jgi:hypothetical protein